MRYFNVLVILIFFSSCLFAQSSLDDSETYRLALSKTLTYNNSREAEAFGLYTGSLYVRDYNNVKGNPFYQTDSFQKGAVFYNGVLYKHVNLLYDLSHDNLVTEYPENIKLILVTEKIKYFKLGDHLFIRLNNSSPAGEGFYDKLNEGEMPVWAKREKHNFHDVFKQQNKYFLEKEGHYYDVNSKKELLNVFNDKRAELKNFISKNKLSFKRKFENALLETVRYYEQISK